MAPTTLSERHAEQGRVNRARWTQLASVEDEGIDTKHRRLKGRVLTHPARSLGRRRVALATREREMWLKRAHVEIGDMR